MSSREPLLMIRRNHYDCFSSCCGVEQPFEAIITLAVFDEGAHHNGDRKSARVDHTQPKSKVYLFQVLFYVTGSRRPVSHGGHYSVPFEIIDTIIVVEQYGVSVSNVRESVYAEPCRYLFEQKFVVASLHFLYVN